MEKWSGAAGICVNEQGHLLMVLQGTPEEEKTWSIPSGGKEDGETFEVCCVREIKEETGYLTKVIEKVQVKKRTYDDVQVEAEVHYFEVAIIGGEMQIQDPDQLIYDIAWKTVDELKSLPLTFPEDRAFLLQYMKHFMMDC